MQQEGPADGSELDQLRRALETRTTIGVAVGIVMERYGLGQDRAFEALSRWSQESNRKLRDLAADLVAGRPLPHRPDRGTRP